MRRLSVQGKKPQIRNENAIQSGRKKKINKKGGNKKKKKFRQLDYRISIATPGWESKLNV